MDNLRLDRDILENEAEGVALWLVNGLNSFIKNGFNITVSDRTKAVSDQIKRENDTVALFLDECTEIVMHPEAVIFSENLRNLYENFCSENVLIALKPKSFIVAVKNKGKAKGIRYSTHIVINGRRARGFEGIGNKI